VIDWTIPSPLQCGSPSTPEGCVDNLAGALRVDDAAFTVRFERGFDAGFFFRGKRRRFIFKGLDDVPARRECAELRWNVFAVPGHDSAATGHT
jgi:hypothetical protein